VDTEASELELDAITTLKWVGGKRRISEQIVSHFPKVYGNYFEPFLGGASVFFRTKPTKAHLSDLNSSLINYYTQLRDSPEALLKSAQKLEARFNNLSNEDQRKSFYYEEREKYNNKSGADRLHDATTFIFLNKTAFNGLYRENAKGEFNVPFNNSKILKLLDPAQVALNSEILREASLQSCGFAEAVQSAVAGDLVYFDPPYVPLSSTAAFTDYTKSSFGKQEQEDLRDLAVSLRSQGVHVVLSNSFSPIVKQLYKGFDLHQLKINRLVAADSSSRGEISEYLIVGLANG
jgi:DNA adenine methylase